MKGILSYASQNSYAAKQQTGVIMSMPADAFDFRAAIEKAISVFEKAASARDAATIANMYADDATLMPQGFPPIKGRNNIQQFWQGFFDAGASDATIRVVDVKSFGDTAYEIGAFEANMPVPQGGTARTQGKYVVVWKRQPDGGLKMLVDIFNTNS
jgi:uncharacterized protein (TIGR02246 family)